MLAVLDEVTRPLVVDATFDEIFAGRQPILMGVEPNSFCWIVRLFCPVTVRRLVAVRQPVKVRRVVSVRQAVRARQVVPVERGGSPRASASPETHHWPERSSRSAQRTVKAGEQAAWSRESTAWSACSRPDTAA